MSTQKRGVFIALEGIDGSGKSTQARILADRLKQAGISVYGTMEPTQVLAGSLIRQALTGRIQADHRVIAALFVADRLDHLLNETNGVCRKIEEGTSVIMDRYCFSSYAYQGVKVPMDWLIQANALCSQILRPDINLFIDTDPDTALARIAANRFETELFEEKSWLVQVRNNYMEAFERLRDSENVVVIDGNCSVDETAGHIWDAVQGYFESRRKDDLL